MATVAKKQIKYKKKTKRQPTLKQRKWLQEYLVNNQNGTQAAMVAYETNNAKMASVISDNNKNSPLLKDLLEKALKDNEITVDTIAEQVKTGLGAEKYEWDEINKCYVLSGLPDHNIRHKYLTTLIDLMGVKAPEKKEIAIRGVLGVGKIEEIRNRVLSIGTEEK